MKAEHKKQFTKLQIIARILFIIIGAALVSVALEIFLIPNNIIDGGVVGLSIMASYLTKLPLGLFTLLLNAPFFILGYKQIGKTFALSTFFSVICLSVGVTVLHSIPVITTDVILASVFGGIILGAGVGMIIRNGGSLDGTEIVAIILDKRISFSIGEIVMFFNLFILGLSGFVFGWDRAMYSLITYFIAFKIIDITIEGLDGSKAIIIISEKQEDIADAIRDRLGRSVTFFDGCNNRGVKTNIIYVVVSRLEISKIKSIVHGFDDNALVSISDVEISGRSFKKMSIH